MRKQFTLFMLLALTACSKNPTVGDQMLSKEQQVNQITTEWQTGNELVRKGEKYIRSGQRLINKGNHMIERGHTKISKGKKMVKNGEKMMKRSEKVFAKEFASKEEDDGD